MPESYRVVVTPGAQKHLADIRDYICLDLDSPAASKRMLDYLLSQIRSLAAFPGRVPLDAAMGELGIHKMTVRNYLIYFWIEEQKRTVHVIAVIYGRMDQLPQILHSLS